ncbi:N-acetylglucosamine-6-phosphate deacetylase [Paracoccus saliphilus]|uniref:N-acetylglucosamine-6-phosphate deacetylase n=1 Tax=Paracoccus saliphilus TaxID=405559 RepID=A0AA46A6F5_9RHOB|nr:N-acetylglucosamine-6-phosphate deacetylase [Paracoccus saliphilus]WCR05475.1 N-acetylglucosamine-6-phosphate deacetylase [Paracoccus saliphilus]SIS97151.1 N-acetylglucosamine 6-phosphate deacetylase [Paracoccus saliphilus]
MLIAADQIWIDGGLQAGHAIETDGEVVTACRPLGGDTPDAYVPLLMSGCTDLQVNGGGGTLLNTDPTVAGIETIAAAHRKLGTARILPTLITDAPEVMEAAADAIIAAKGRPGIMGIHLEGPHIAPEKRGTHDTRFIRLLDDRTLAVLRRLRQADVPVLLTLAPERANPVLLREAAAMGVVLSAGHSMATAAEARTALDNGVTMFTHLYNAMPQMNSREPGMIAAAILSDAWCGLITDGIHVSPEMLQVTLNARPRPDRCFIVSDSMPTIGGPDHFNLYGMDIHVRDGALVNSEGSLAGAHIDMITSIRRLVRMTGIAPDRAIAMATDIPCAAMGFAPLRIAPGMPLTDLVALDDGLRLIDIPGTEP